MYYAYSLPHCTPYLGKDGVIMNNNTDKSNKAKNAYDDDNIPEIDLPKTTDKVEPAEPLPESSRPRKDGPGGE